MKNMIVALAMLVGFGLQAQTPGGKPGIQQKIPDGCFNPEWDEENEVWICESYGGSGNVFNGTQMCSRCNSVWAYVYLTLGVKEAKEFDKNGVQLRLVAQVKLNDPAEKQMAYNKAVDEVCQLIANGRGCI